MKGVSIMRLADMVTNIPHVQNNSEIEIRKFLHLLEITLAYSPDRPSEPNYITPLYSDNDFRSHTAKIIQTLEREFLERFYIDRWEKES